MAGKLGSTSEVPRRVEEASIGKTAAIAAISGIVAIGVTVVFQAAPNVDVAWFLYVAGEMLDGRRLYMDFVEINTPLAAFLAEVPVALARVWGMSSITSFRLFVLLLVFFCVWLSTALVARWLRVSALRAIVVWGVPLLLATLWVPGADFGEREHLLMLMLFPYAVLVAWRADEGQPPGFLAFLAGLGAGLGVALKPHFAFIWVVLEGCLLLRRGFRWRRGEILGIAIFPVATALLLMWSKAYWTMLHEYLGMYREYWRTSALNIALHLPATLVAAFAAPLIVRRASGSSRSLLQMLAALLIAGLLVGLAQQKGWTYHFYPAHAAAVSLLGFAALSGVCHFSRRRLARLALGTAAVAFLATAMSLHRWDVRIGDPAPEAVQLARRYAAGQPIVIFSVRMWQPFPLVNEAGVKWASRFNTYWPLQALYAHSDSSAPDVRFRSPEQMGEGERSFFAASVEDVLRARPRLVYVDVEPEPLLGGRRFDYLRYFGQDPRLGEELTRYAPLARVGRLCVYLRGGSGGISPDFRAGGPNVESTGSCPQPHQSE